MIIAEDQKRFLKFRNGANFEGQKNSDENRNYIGKNSLAIEAESKKKLIGFYTLRKWMRFTNLILVTKTVGIKPRPILQVLEVQ